MIERIDNYFNKTEYYGDLDLIYIFHEYDGVPLLFVVIDSKGNLYLTCCSQPKGFNEWSLSSVTLNDVQAMVLQETTVTDVFVNSANKFLLFEQKDGDVTAHKVEKYGTHDIPPANTYLEFVTVTQDEIGYIEEEQNIRQLEISEDIIVNYDEPLSETAQAIMQAMTSFVISDVPVLEGFTESLFEPIAESVSNAFKEFVFSPPKVSFEDLLAESQIEVVRNIFTEEISIQDLKFKRLKSSDVAHFAKPDLGENSSTDDNKGPAAA